jgi:hypothetical protein
MAFKINQIKKLNQVYIICQGDDAIDWEASDVEAYRESLDEKHLVAIQGKEPTRFLCNFEIDAKTASLIEDSMIAGMDKSGNIKPGLGNYNLTIVKYVLKDIKNPDYLKPEEMLTFKRHGDGSVSDETLNQLARIGVMSEIAGIFIGLTKSQKNKVDVKN